MTDFFKVAIATSLILLFLAFLRLLAILPPFTRARPHPKLQGSPSHLIAVLGSGGHTAEALHLLSSLDLSKFTYRTYIVSSGDAFSAQKAADFERARGSLKSSFTIKEIPRARRVGQSWISTPASCLQCLMGCVAALAGREGSHNWGMADVVVCNGPGSAVMVVLACLYYKLIGMATTRTIYVESFTRVASLSLSGKILYLFVDRFIVQWPVVAQRYPRAEYHGLLV